MQDKTFDHLDAVPLLIFCPHRIKPPDVWSPVSFSRNGIWLYVIFLFLLLLPRVDTNRWSEFDSFARNLAEEWLSQGLEYPRNLEGFELGFISRVDSLPLSVAYNVTPNNASWLFVTPCSHKSFLINIQSVVDRDENSVANLSSISGKGTSSEWYKKVTEVDMMSSSGFGENIFITSWKRQEIFVKNLKLGIMKALINNNDPDRSVYMIRQYSGRIDAFYPKIPSDSSIKVCRSDQYSSMLNIYVTRAYNTDLYCATFNLEEELPNFCTAQLRIDKELFYDQKNREKVNIRRPNIFDAFYSKSSKVPIYTSEFRCFRQNRFNVTLDKIFTKRPLFISVYAVNTVTEFTDSYEPVKYYWRDRDESCNPLSSMVAVNMARPSLWVMGNETIFVNISTRTTLLYRGCMFNGRQTLKVLKRDSQEGVCVEVPDRRVKELCKKEIASGQYSIQHNLDGPSDPSKAVGQIFLSRNIQSFPQLFCNKTQDYSLHLSRELSKSERDKYTMNISFSGISSPYKISYYFHILEYPNQTFDEYSAMDAVSKIKPTVRAQRNFCNIINYPNQLPIHKVTLKGKGCKSKVGYQEVTSIPELLDVKSIYAVFVYFSRESEWITDVMQFYNNTIFTMEREEPLF